MIIQRLISSWCIINIIFLLINQTLFSVLDYMQDFNLFVFVGLILILFGLITLFSHLFKKLNLDNILIAVSILLYSILLLSQHTNIYFFIGIMSAVTICGYYLLKDDKLKLESLRVSNNLTKVIVIFLALFFVIFVGGLTTLRYLTYSSPNFDFGIFSNMFYNMKETLLPNASCERDMILSHFAIHVSPIYYLILPFYFIFPSPICLEIIQSVILASGMIPIFLLTKHFGLSNKVKICICSAYCFYPALMGGCFYDIHENKFLTPLLLWLFYFLEKKKYSGVYVFALLVMMVKEDAPIYIAFIALYIIISKKQYKHGIILFLFSIFYFIGVTTLLETFGRGVMSNRYDNYIQNEDDGLKGIIKTVLLNPAYVFKESFTAEKFVFIIQMLVPIGFLPFINKNISKLILILPFILINLMSNYKYQYSITFQYTYGVTAIFFYLIILNISEMREKSKKYFSAFIITATFLLFICTIYQKNYYIEKYINNYDDYKIISECLEKIPNDASVQASTFFVPKLSQRKEIYQHESKNKTDYIILDIRPESKTEFLNYFYEYNNKGYEIVDYYENLIIVFKSTY